MRSPSGSPGGVPLWYWCGLGEPSWEYHVDCCALARWSWRCGGRLSSGFVLGCVCWAMVWWIADVRSRVPWSVVPVSYTHLRAHETSAHL
eukprot:10475865-Alexandrium_andersonii.AAC.1